MPFSLLRFTVGPGFGSLRFHSFAIGLGSHNEFPPVFVVVRASTNPWRVACWLVFHPNKYYNRSILALENALARRAIPDDNLAAAE
jgi:hypothetical protein